MSVGAVTHAGHPANPSLSAACGALGSVSDGTNLDAVLDLVVVPQPRVRYGDWAARCDAARMALRRWFGPEHVAPALARVDQVDSVVAESVFYYAVRVARAGDAPVVLGVLDRVLGAGQPNFDASNPMNEQRMLRGAPAARLAQGCINVLGAIGDEAAVDRLRQLVGHPALGGLAVEALLKVDGFDAASLHARILTDAALREFAAVSFQSEVVAEDPELRAAAIALLAGWTGEDPSSATFLHRLPEPERRAVASAIVERVRENEPPSSEVTLAALTALGDLRDVELIAVLAIGLEDADEVVREQAVFQLQRTFSPDASPYLIEMLKDDSASVVTAARYALERIETYLEEAETWRNRYRDYRKQQDGKDPR